MIGGVATISGCIMGAVFITFLERFVGWLSGFLPFISDANAGAFLKVSNFEPMLFGLLIDVFLIVKPLRLYGLSVRVRNYFQGLAV